LDGVFLAALYHPRAGRLEWEFQPQLHRWRAAELRPTLSSFGGKPCTTPYAWLYRDLFNGIFG